MQWWNSDLRNFVFYFILFPEGAATLKAPEPIKFFPSSLEQEKQNTETYICLFKDFYPDVIRMHWKEEGSDKILESQQSDPFKVKDKYWQMSWLTVKKSSPGKIYRLIYKHEKTGRVEKEELFPAPASVPTTTSTEASTTVETSVPTTTSTKTSTTVETSVPTTTSTEASTTVESKCLFVGRSLGNGDISIHGLSMLFGS
uniref:Immunoglobulin C1-set domain-containing protein n=1 Tax=Ornithorhynchus anatinus TaxID=9258 RepID=F6XF80_ORNAN